MAVMNLSLRPLEFSTSTTAVNHRKPASFLRRRPSISISFATASAETTATSTVEKPAIELEFIGPKPDADGKLPVDRTKAISGEKLLRNIMLDNKIELYATYGKVMNCGGGGSCGTCIVEIIDGKDLLNERTNTELRYLKKAWLLPPDTLLPYFLQVCRGRPINQSLGG